MRFLSFFAVAVIAAASLTVSGCGGSATTPSDGSESAAPAASEGSSSSTTPATGDGLTSVSFNVKGMT